MDIYVVVKRENNYKLEDWPCAVFDTEEAAVKYCQKHNPFQRTYNCDFYEFDVFTLNNDC